MTGLIISLPAMGAQLITDRNILMPEQGKEWKTLETPHFRIHHEAGNREYVQEVAAIAERVHDKLSVWLGWNPKDKTEVVILDTVDASNGSATPLPYNTITLYMPTPVSGELMDQTPWLEFVFTHEYVHILHLDMAFGAPQVMRDIFGRSMDLFTLFDFPQIFAPTWVAEGLAVYGESELAGQSGKAGSTGRLNSAMFEAMMRMEVKRGLYSLTEVSYNSAHRWPYGQVYLYGAYFFKFAEEKYGREAVIKYIKVYGRHIFPFRMDTRAKKVFGKPGKVVWTEYQEYLRQRFAPQLVKIKQQNTFATRTVYDGLYTNSALAAASNGDLYFLHDDASSSPEIRRIRAEGVNEKVTDGRGVQHIDWHEKSGLLLSKYAVCDNTNVYADIFQWSPGMSSARQLTHCGRYTFAAWHPDGQSIAAIQSERGLSRLLLLDVNGKTVRALAEMNMGDTLGHLAWSPDGKTLVASIQRRKTGWNLEILDVSSGLWQALTIGTHLVQRPRYSRDGSEIYFLSDQGKVWNLRRLNLGSDRVETISNTESAISEAVAMPDGSYRLVEYTHSGKAIVALEAAISQTDASYPAKNAETGAVDAISNAPDFKAYAYADVKDYSPWNTLKPHFWFPLFDNSADQASFVGVLLGGSDALDFHQWNALPLYYYDQKVFGGLANYSFYNKITLSAQRQFFMLGDKESVNRQQSDETHYQALLHHSFNTLDSSLYVAAGAANEVIGTQVIRGTGTGRAYNNKITGVIVQYDNSKFYKRSISLVDGRRVQLLSETYDQLGGSDYSGKTTRLDWKEYVSLGDNHALHFRALYAQGDAGIRPYRLGGVSETLSQIGGVTGLGRRDFPLRGYPSGLGALTGTNFGMATAEWRIPLGYHYDGWFFPPFGVGRESLTLFVDGGDAWNQGEEIRAKTGVGMEWNIEALLGYDLLKVSTTLGFAHGQDVGGENLVYFRLTIPLL
jgi:Tol biopolymer transport system component